MNYPLHIIEELERLRKNGELPQPEIELDVVPPGYWDDLDEALKKMPKTDYSDDDEPKPLFDVDFTF